MSGQETKKGIQRETGHQTDIEDLSVTEADAVEVKGGSGANLQLQGGFTVAHEDLTLR